MSWQRPKGLVWSEPGSCAAALRGRGIAVLLAGAAALTSAQQPYALLGQPAPDFALHAAGGGNVRLSEHRGEVVVLSFWSSRCTPCRTQLAALDRSLATYRSAGLAMYGVGVDDDAARSREYAHAASVAFPMLLDPEKGVSREYGVDNLPMTVLIDRNGVVRQVLRDFSGASQALYLRQLRGLLNE